MGKRTLVIEIDPRKSIYENAAIYFEKAKKLKKKLERLERHIKELKERSIKKSKHERKEEKSIFKGEWYERFRWFLTSNGFLFVIGKDAETNEILVKRYAKEWDLVFHADIYGSPFGVLKTNRKIPTEKDIIESATFLACFSRAWKYKLYSVEVYWVKREQVSKRAPSGEYLKRGSFMIYGKKNYLRVNLEYGIGISGEDIVWGPGDIVKEKCDKYFILIPGEQNINKIYEEISRTLNIEIKILQKLLPPWDSNIKELKV